ncbi:SepM family pheromone-processing serine protease [Bacillus spongiae]|uniref:endopeptidase La n=1 Tax=Bacillus spongiae TaxID=2683610 RepID=A0ABU8HA61_9BACI
MSRKVRNRVIIIVGVVLILLPFYRLPFYVTKPGGAHDVTEIVEIQEGYEQEGAFFITTVQMGKANIYTYLSAKFLPYHNVFAEEEVRRPEESDEAYATRQLYYMENSTHNAVITAFEAASKPYELSYEGIYVLNVFPQFEASKVIKPGDRIIKIDDQSFNSSKEFIEYVQQKQPNDQVSVTIIREEEKINHSITLQEYEDGKAGIGIELVDDRELSSSPEVKWDTSTIGGPSAGLLFSLEVYNRLVPEDISKGYEIAGTGTISENGEVGRIGGIEQKIVAADSAGAEIFLAPNDEITAELRKEFPEMKSNYDAAVETAKEIESEMVIVPVKTFDEALAYLKDLTTK